LWLTLAASWLAAVPLAALALAVPLMWQAPGGRGGGTFTGTGGVPAAVAGMLLAVAVVVRASWCLGRGLARARRDHRAHAAFLAAAGRPDHALGAVIIDADAPAAYCLPRGRHRMVITTSALSRLSPGQLRAVLAHERAHLRGHHHLMLAAAAALARAFPAMPLLTRASAELAVLAEMTADDHAARRHSAADLAAALVTLAGAGQPQHRAGRRRSRRHSPHPAAARAAPAATAPGQGRTAGRRHRGIPHPSRDSQPPASHRCMRHHLQSPVIQQETAPEAVSLALLRACEGTVACKATSVTDPAALTG
jgi:Zn-dependent protease with chaperone function